MSVFDLTEIKSARAGRIVGRRVVYLVSANSTNDAAKDLARRRAPEGTLVLAEEQTSGKGRLGRTWTSPAGSSILLSIILRPSATRLAKLTMMASLAAARAGERSTGLPAFVKWPNDVIIGGKKAGGILIEAELSGRVPRFAVVGIGLNVNLDVRAVSEIPETATSVSMELGREFSRQDLLLSLLDELETAYAALKSGISIERDWRARLETLGRWVRVTRMIGPPLEGRAEDVDAQGRLLLRLSDSSLETLSEGDVSLSTKRGHPF